MKKVFKKLVSSIILFPIVVYLIINGGKFIFVDYINLLIHEGGHGIFKIFGKFIYTLGGTLTQIAIPSMFAIYYLSIRKKCLTQLSFLWLGENFLNISVYAADAQTQKLPLLGGKNVYHDWAYILGNLGMLDQDYIVGSMFFLLGIITFILCLLIPLIIGDYRESGK